MTYICNKNYKVVMNGIRKDTKKLKKQISVFEK